MGEGEYGKEVQGGSMNVNSYVNEKRQKEIVEVLFSNAGKVLFRLASVELKIHEGRLVSVSYSTMENTRQKEAGANEAVRSVPM